MQPSTNIRQQAINLIEQLPQTKLGQVIAFLESLLQSNSESLLNQNEADLISVIQYSFAPEIQERLDQLRDTAEWCELLL